MKTILKNKWFIIVAAIFGFASFANAAHINYHDSLNAAGYINEVYTVNVPSACGVHGEIYIRGNGHAHIEVWSNVGGQILSLDSTQQGCVIDSGGGPGDIYYTEHSGNISGSVVCLEIRTVISWN